MIVNHVHESECRASRPFEGSTFRDPAPERHWTQVYSEVLPWWLRILRWLAG